MSDLRVNRNGYLVQKTPTSLQTYKAMLRHLGMRDRQEVRYLRFLFAGIPLAARGVLDVGGGNGVVSFYASVRGAVPMVCLEPAAAGSNPAMDDQFLRFSAGLSDITLVELVRAPVQEFTYRRPFDVVVLNNVVNHIDEEACARLPADPAAQATYRDTFRHLAELTKPGGHLIVADAARRNLFGDRGRTSPFAPSIEWRIHAQPEVWASIAAQVGFTEPRIRWNTHRRLGAVGQLVLGNRVGGYLTNSHFVLTMRRQ